MGYQLKTRQICLFFIAFLPVTKIFMLPSVLASVAGADMWISTALCILLDGATVLAVAFACKSAKTDFYGLLELNFGKVISKIIMGAYLVYFLMKAVLPLHEQRDYIMITLYETFPNIITFVPFFIIAFYLAMQKTRILGRCADILWTITSIGLILIFALSVSNAEFEALLPLGKTGFGNIARAGYNSLTWFGDGAYFAFFFGKFAYKKRDALKITLSYFAAGLAVVLFMIIFYCTFTSIAHRQTFALTEISKYSSVINNIGRFDYIGILLILFSSVISLSLPLYFASQILNKLTGFKRRWISPLIVSGVNLLFLFFFGEYFASIEHFILNYAGIYFLLFGNILPITTLFMKKENERRALYQS